MHPGSSGDVLAAFVLPLVLSAGSLMWLGWARARGQKPSRWAHSLVFSVAGLCAVYYAGIVSGRMHVLGDIEDICGGPVSSGRTMTVIPLSSLCHMADGTQIEQVPAAANWVIAAAAAVVAVCATGAALSAGHRQRDRVAG